MQISILFLEVFWEQHYNHALFCPCRWFTY